MAGAAGMGLALARLVCDEVGIRAGAAGTTAIAGLSTREYGGHVVVALHGELDIVDAASVMAVLTASGSSQVDHLPTDA